MDYIYLVKTTPGLLVVCCGFLGLIVGSFLNVVIYRLPKMLEAAWKGEAKEILGLPQEASPRLSLIYPHSSCPNCGAHVRAWENIPVISWLLLKGKCAKCSAAISFQYPFVELISAIAAIACSVQFGWSPQLLPALIFTWCLIALAIIDVRTMLLPDAITLPLLWLGLLLALIPAFANLHDAVIGAAAGYLILWSIFHLFKLLTGKEGMGYGDFKLLAALGAWLGWGYLPMIILLSSIVGAAIGICMVIARRLGKDMPIPFGPYLAGAGWIALLYGPALQLWYFESVGLRQ